MMQLEYSTARKTVTPNIHMLSPPLYIHHIASSVIKMNNLYNSMKNRIHLIMENLQGVYQLFAVHISAHTLSKVIETLGLQNGKMYDLESGDVMLHTNRGSHR